MPVRLNINTIMMNQFLKKGLFPAFIFLMISCNPEQDQSFAYGNFESVDILISAESSGIIEEVFVEEGQQLSAGEPIALVDTTQLDLQKKQLIAARKGIYASLAQLDAEIDVQTVRIENIERELKRFGTLFLEEAATKKQMDDLEGNVKTLEAQLKAMHAKKHLFYAELEANRAQMESLEDKILGAMVKAPSPGTVLEVFSSKGEMTMAGKALIKMADLSQLTLRVFVAGDQLSLLKTNDIVGVLYDGKEELKKTEGRVSWISSQAEFTPKIIQTREERVNLVYAVKIQVPNPGEIKIGMPGEIFIPE